MKVVILAGGYGTRLAEETEAKPKPMVEIGGHPILWHIMKHYAHYGHKDFYVALGYKSHFIKRYFIDYHELAGSMTVDLRSGSKKAFDDTCEDWVINLVDTGLDSLTGDRVKKLQKWLSDDTFMITYGDGVSNIDINKLLEFHRAHGKLATLSAVRPPARFGGLVFQGDQVSQFTEKPQTGEGWINGGFLVFEPGVFDHLQGTKVSLEANAMATLASSGQLMAYRHEGFWQCVDTLRDLKLLRKLWDSGGAEWKIWD